MVELARVYGKALLGLFVDRRWVLGTDQALLADHLQLAPSITLGIATAMVLQRASSRTQVCCLPCAAWFQTFEIAHVKSTNVVLPWVEASDISQVLA